MHRIKIIQINEGKGIQTTAEILKVKEKKTTKQKNAKHPTTCFQPEETFTTSQTFTEIQTFFDQEQIQIIYMLLSSV